eukprot:3864713-Amphidinium_carterae.1
MSLPPMIHAGCSTEPLLRRNTGTGLKRAGLKYSPAVGPFSPPCESCFTRLRYNNITNKVEELGRGFLVFSLALTWSCRAWQGGQPMSKPPFIGNLQCPPNT